MNYLTTLALNTPLIFTLSYWSLFHSGSEAGHAPKRNIFSKRRILFASLCRNCAWKMLGITGIFHFDDHRKLLILLQGMDCNGKKSWVRELFLNLLQKREQFKSTCTGWNFTANLIELNLSWIKECIKRLGILFSIPFCFYSTFIINQLQIWAFE